MNEETTSLVPENLMTPNVQRHMEILKEMNLMYAKKNYDYGDSVHQMYKEEGMAMFRVRLGDKINRFNHVTRKGDQANADETVRDTLMDLANYAIMAILEIDNKEEG